MITSGLPRTLETARIVAPAREPEPGRSCASSRAAGSRTSRRTSSSARSPVHSTASSRDEARFLGGETIGSLLDRVLPALDRLLADEDWDTLLAVLHGGVNRAIVSHALTGERVFLGGLEQAPACMNILDVGEASSSARSTTRPTIRCT